MAIYDDLKLVIDQIIADYKQANADGKLTFKEMFTLVSNATATFIRLVESVNRGTDAEKKAAVLAAVSHFYDTVIAPLDIPGIPNIVEGVVDSSLKLLVMALVDPLIDSLVNIFNKTGWNFPSQSDPARLQTPLVY